MARLVGIEISSTSVRAVAVTSSYRRVTVEHVAEVERASVSGLEEAIRAVAGSCVSHGESVAIAIDGSQAYLQQVRLPLTALRQLDQVVPFELESRVPVDIEELVFDHVLVPKVKGEDVVRLLVAAAPIERVRALLEAAGRALGRNVERVGAGPLPLANLLGHLGTLATVQEPVAIVDLGARRLDVLVVERGQAVFSRTSATGIAVLPEGAVQIAAALRQSLSAYAASGGASVSAVYLTGEGASVAGAEAYLSAEVRIPVLPLPPLSGIDVPEALRPGLPRYAKALAIALGLGPKPRDPDLRKGPLGFQRGYAFLKDKAPLLSGLGTAVLISLMFSTWAELRALEKQESVLTAELGQVSRAVLGEETSDATVALDTLQKRRASEEADPMPYMDAFDVVVELSGAVPEGIAHDIEEFDMQKEHVKLTGIVGSAAEAQEVMSKLKEHRCFQEMRLGKVTQVVNSDRQKYGLEWDVRCPEDQSSKAKKKTDKADKPAESAGGVK